MSSHGAHGATVRDDVLPLTRPQRAKARRLRAAELLEQGHSQTEVARMVGACAESVRRWKRRMEQGGQAVLRRRPASGRPSKLTDIQVEQVRQAWRPAPKHTGLTPICGRWSG